MHVRVLLSVIVWILNMSTPHLSEFSKIWKEYQNVHPVIELRVSRRLASFAFYSSAQLVATQEPSQRLWPWVVSTEWRWGGLTGLDVIINYNCRSWAIYITGDLPLPAQFDVLVLAPLHTWVASLHRNCWCGPAASEIRRSWRGELESVRPSHTSRPRGPGPPPAGGWRYQLLAACLQNIVIKHLQSYQ